MTFLARSGKSLTTRSTFTSLSARMATSAARNTLHAKRNREMSRDQFMGRCRLRAMALVKITRQEAQKQAAATKTSTRHTCW
jgi:hypothetical protein